MTGGPGLVTAVRLVVLLAAVMALTSGCSPYPVPEDDRAAELSATVTADAHIDVNLALGGRPPHADLLRIGRAVGAALTPGAPTASVDQNPGGHPFVALDGGAAFPPGPAPVVQWDPTAALEVLRQHGYTDISMELTAPTVPTTVEWTVPPSETYPSTWRWDDWAPPDQVPAGMLKLSPRPGRSMAALAVVAVAMLGAAVAWTGLRRRQPGRAVAGSVAASVALLATLGAGGVVQVESLAVAGYVSGPAYRVLFGLPLMTVPAAITTWVLVGLTASSGNRRVSPG